MHEKLSLNLYKRTNYARILIAAIHKKYKKSMWMEKVAHMNLHSGREVFYNFLV